MDIPFKLLFIQNSGRNNEVKKGNFLFVNSEKELYQMNQEDTITIIENIDVSLVFTAPTNSRLYMDGLDTLPESIVHEDTDGEVYLKPSDVEYVLFSFAQQEQYYPLIPGFYKICVIVSNKKYFSWLRVLPKQVNEEQWEKMRDEIEETLHGLAQDLIRRNSNITGFGENPIPVFYMRQWMLLQNYRNSLLTTLEDISKKPRYSIVKKYQNVPTSKAKRIDNITIKHISQQPEKNNLLTEAKPTINYNLLENRWLLKIVNELMEIIKNLLKAFKVHEESLLKEINGLERWHKNNDVRLKTIYKTISLIKNMHHECNQIKNALIRLLKQYWISEVTKENTTTVSNNLVLDSRYQLLFKLYRELKGDTYSINLDSSYKYHWKRSDHLYEIWGFITVIKALCAEEIGFSPVKGWLYDLKDYKTVLVPELVSGSYVELINPNSLKIRITYDSELPAHPNDTNLEQPIYITGDNFRPDCRLDLYDKVGYIGSFIIDFKYRPKRYIWDKNKVRTRKQNKNMKQLDIYQNSSRSNWFLKDRVSKRILEQFRPVFEVWAVYPDKDDRQLVREIDEYKIRLIDLTPAKDNLHFVNTLLEVIEYVKDTSIELIN